jgi:hypothetical protein
LLPLDINEGGFLTMTQTDLSRCTLNLNTIKSRNVVVDYRLMFFPSVGGYIDRTGDKFLIKNGKLETWDVKAYANKEPLPEGLQLKRKSKKSIPEYFPSEEGCISNCRLRPCEGNEIENYMKLFRCPMSSS